MWLDIFWYLCRGMESTVVFMKEKSTGITGGFFFLDITSYCRRSR